MKKNLLSVLIGFLLTLFSCEQNKQGQPAKFTTGTAEINRWFDTFHNDRVFEVLMDSIHYEYPLLMSDVKFLDSIKGLKIDFIGMIHSKFPQPPDLDPENAVVQCQTSIDRIIDTGKYTFIGTENSYRTEKLDWGTFIKDSGEDMDNLSRIRYGRINHTELYVIDQMDNQQVKKDLVFNRLFSRVNVPYIIGIEPKWPWLTEQVMRDEFKNIPSENTDAFRRFIQILDLCRTEIALARTARQLIKEGRDKKAVIVYGYLHMEYFRFLAKKYGTVSNFTIPAECSIRTN